MNKKILIILSMLLFHQTVLWSQTPQWSVDASQYEFSMTITGRVFLDGQFSFGNDHILAAEIDSEIRGVATPVYDQSLDRYLFFLTIFSNGFTGENVSFKYYDADSDQITDLWNEVEFTNASNMGSISQPYIFFADQPDTMSVVTFIIEDDQGNPLPDAVLTFDGQTMSAGEYIVQDVAPGTYNWEVAKDGFVTQSDQLVVEQGQPGVDVYVVLEQEITDPDPELYEVHFFVFDIEGNILDDYELLFDGEQYSGQSAIIDVEPGVYPYEVNKTGYLIREGQITVASSNVYLDIVLLEEPLNTRQWEQAGFAVFPNPAQGFVNVRTKEHTPNSTVHIYSYSGKLLMSHPVTCFQVTVDVSSLSRGIYIIRVISQSGEEWMEKLILH